MTNLPCDEISQHTTLFLFELGINTSDSTFLRLLDKSKSDVFIPINRIKQEQGNDISLMTPCDGK
jgi:hypothetical protein